MLDDRMISWGPPELLPPDAVAAVRKGNREPMLAFMRKRVEDKTAALQAWLDRHPEINMSILPTAPSATLLPYSRVLCDAAAVKAFNEAFPDTLIFLNKRNVNMLSRKTKDDSESATLVGILVSRLIVLPVSMICWAFTISTFWSWFGTPLGLPPVSLVHALGLQVTLKMLGVASGSRMVLEQILTNVAAVQAATIKDYTPPSFEDKLGMAVAEGMVAPAIFLTLGWVIHYFM